MAHADGRIAEASHYRPGRNASCKVVMIVRMVLLLLLLLLVPRRLLLLLVAAPLPTTFP